MSPTTAAQDPRRPRIRLGMSDHRRLQNLGFAALLSRPRVAGPLLDELDRADVLPDHALPPDVVRLDAWVTYTEDGSGAGEPQRVRLVASSHAPAGALSVLTAIGAALVGLGVGQSILWADHLGGDHYITVREVGHGPATIP